MSTKIMLLATILAGAIVVGAVAVFLLPSPTRNTHGPTQTFEAAKLYFENHGVYDSGLETDAFSILLPEGWRLEGGIEWRTERPLLPASLAFRATDSSGFEGVEVFPDQAYFWVEGQGLLIPYDYGPALRQQYALEYQGYEARQPMGAVEYISKVLIPRYRNGVSNLDTVSTASLNDSDIVVQLKNSLAQRPQGPFPEQVSVEAAGVRVAYEEDGRGTEEEFWAIIVIDTFSTTPEMEQVTGVRMTSTFWYASGLWSVKSEREGLSAENAKTIMTVLNSFRWNPAWLDRYAQLLLDIWQKHLQGIMDRQYVMTQAQNEISRIIDSTFANQEATMDRISERWSEVIRGVETYDPAPGLAEFGTDAQPPVQLPNGYDYAWTNGQGDYILTDSALFNPNVDLQTGSNWVQMKKR